VYFPQCRALIGQRAQDQGRHGRVKGTVGRGEPFGNPVLDLDDPTGIPAFWAAILRR